MRCLIRPYKTQQTNKRCSMRNYLFVSSFWFIIGLSAQAEMGSGEGAVAEPKTYRMDNYRAPVPETLLDVTVVNAGELRALINDVSREVILIDVFPLHPKPVDFPEDRLWRPPTRYNLPASVWLPNVGYGSISPQLKQYFVDNLKRLSTGVKPEHFVFYCAADCWMSWNAAKRALELGFDNIYWFPGGTDEWEIMNYALTVSKPVEMPAGNSHFTGV